VIRSAEIHTHARVAGVVKPLPEFAKQKLDFASARLGETRTRPYRDGAGAIGHVVEIPGDKPILIEVKVAVRRGKAGVLQSLGARIRGLIQSVIQRFSRKPGSPYEFGRALRTHLRQLLRDELPQHMGHGISEDQLFDLAWPEIKLRQEATDFTIVQRELPASHGTRDLAG
jgi:hypothetical protein